MLRQQLPVYSPLGCRALLSGAVAAAGGNRSRERLRKQLVRRFSARRALLTDSGTTALALALAEAARSRGGPAALPAYCCYDVATAADAAGVDVVLYDVEPDRLAPDPHSLTAAMERNPSSVVAAHLYGVPFDVETVREAARSVGALFIEDAAQGIGAKWRGRPVGSEGDVSVLSFGRGKGLTGGGGGSLLANSANGEIVVRSVSGLVATASPGWNAVLRAVSQWALGRPSLYWLPASLPFLALGETIYREPEPAAGMPAACVAMLLSTMETSEEEAARRRRHARRLVEALVREPDMSPIEVSEPGTPGWLRLPLLAHGTRVRSRLSSSEARKRGVMPGYPKPLSRLRGFEDRCLNPRADFRGAETLAASLFTLPTHGLLTNRDLNDLSNFLEGRRTTVPGGSRL